MSNEKKLTTKDKILDLLGGGDAFQSLSDLEAIKLALDAKIDEIKPEPKVEDYWKETEVPVDFDWIVDGKIVKSVKLKTPTGHESCWFATQLTIDDEGRAIVTGEKTLIDLRAECAVKLSGYSLDQIRDLQGPDFDRVIGAAFDFFTDPAELTIWQGVTT
ncbi:hypothetical protein [uncultured Cohaesibacter sp.]|uniref:hypothetical protein n=1 Tax=uncultured Cohaesibacter sp. TaxID=1002546 RepID=UPI0029C92293|nr:hypothetical protein [uncultured Cohaesibacter sp.]